MSQLFASVKSERTQLSGCGHTCFHGTSQPKEMPKFMVTKLKIIYMAVGRHRGMIANEHIRVDSNSYEKVKTFKYLGSLCRDLCLLN